MPLKMLKPKHYEETFAVNVFSGFEFIKILTRKKYLGENASFIIISSIMGLLGQKGISVYSSSKGAIVNGIKSLALELADKYIRVNSIAPAIVKTEMTQNLFSKMSENNMKEIEKMHPLGFGETEDVANACIYLLSDASKWITGTNLIIDGGYSAQ
jgi:NAD(P)-dependent dehydrogenase (short-subunit alcohol dehydrogenase family)